MHPKIYVGLCELKSLLSAATILFDSRQDADGENLVHVSLEKVLYLIGDCDALERMQAEVNN